MVSQMQDDVHAESLRDPENFWRRQAEQIDWNVKPTRALQRTTKTLSDGTTHAHCSWFPDGRISTSHNCVDRHVKAGRGKNVAIIWESPVTGTTEQYTYNELLTEVETLAGVLQDQGVTKGDVVLVYMPMVPAALFAILAIVRLGAIHTVVFGGFSSVSLAQRIEASAPKVIMTASCGIEGKKGPLPYQQLVEDALGRTRCVSPRVLVWQRSECPWAINNSSGQRDWQRLVQSAKDRGVKAGCTAVGSNEGLYIIYTSGTTGTPKGVLREAGGHAVGLNMSMRYIFGVYPQDVMFCASDIGWVVGHCYILYGPLLAGATTVLFEGKPVGTPNAGTFWRIVAKHRVDVLFTAPTALRAIRRDDPDNIWFDQIGRKGGLRTLRALFLAGERSELALVRMYQELLRQHAAPEAQVVDNWWSSETGSPISAIALAPQSGHHFNAPRRQKRSVLPTKVGSAGKMMPGFDVRVVSDNGKELPRGTMGNIVLSLPLAPTAFTTLFNDASRYYNGYLKRFNSSGKWLDTGDAGILDMEGYLHVMARSDDIINVAAHRFSTGAIEQAVGTHRDIAECCVVGIPDQMKGHLPFAFVTLATSQHPENPIADSRLFNEVQINIKQQIGSVAALGGMIQGKGIIPRTRSGKTLRRVLRDLLEHAVEGRMDGEVAIPATIEDASAVDEAREMIRRYFAIKEKLEERRPIDAKSKL